MTEMPEPVALPRQPFLPHASRFASENQTFAQHVQTLQQLSVPNANIYHALSSEQPVPNLVETFHSATGEIDRWLDNANNAITTLELDVREGASVKNVSEMDVLIHTFVPNIELFQELAQAILDHSKAPEDEPRRGEINDTKERIQHDWLDVKAYFGRVKKEMSESKQRRELLDNMDQIITLIEELHTNIFEYQEQRHNGFASGADGEPFPIPKLSSSPTSRNQTLTSGNVTELSQRSDVALMQLDSRLEPLSARIEYLRSRLSAKNAPSDPTGTLAKKHKSLSEKWDTLCREMESLREELKEVGWLAVFKQVSGQANQMMDSLERAVRQCKDFYSRVVNRSDSPLPPRLQQQSRGSTQSRYNQRRESPQPIQPPTPLTQKSFQRLFKNFDAKRKYYVPAVTKMLTMLGNGINTQMTKDIDAIKKYKQMKERWDNILDGVSDVQRDMPHLEQIMESQVIPSNSPPTSLPSSIASSSPPMSPSMRPARGVFSPESEAPGPRPLSPYRRVVSPGDRDRSLSPHNNARSPSLRSKSPSPRAMSPLGRTGYLAPNGRRSVSPPREPDRQWGYDHPRYTQQYPPPYPHGNSYRRAISPQPVYDRNSARSKSASRPESPMGPNSTRPMSPAASAIPRPVTSMGITGRSTSRAGIRSFIPQPSTPAPGMMSRISMSSPTPPLTSPRRGQSMRSSTPNSVRSDNLRPSTPDSQREDDDDEDDDDDDDEEDGRLTPLSATLNRMSLTGGQPPYVPARNDPLDAEVAKVVNDSVIPVKVERATGGGGKYYFGQEGNGQTRKLYLCRLMDYKTGRKVMVRVGGGWQDLDMFLLNHAFMGNINVRGLY